MMGSERFRGHAANGFLLALLLLSACAGKNTDNIKGCTTETVGTDTGSAIVTLTLLVPDQFMTGAEISNGGVIALGDKCPAALDAMFSRDTAEHVIQIAKDFPLRHSGFHVAQAQMLIWKFKDDSGQTSFFVESLMSVTPAKSTPRG